MTVDIHNLPGMKRRELQTCICCRKGVAHCGITFYRLKIERFMLDPNAIRERAGMEMMMGGGGGGALLAEVMGPDKDLAKRFSDEMTVLICEDCSMGWSSSSGKTITPPHVAEMMERAVERVAKKAGGDEDGEGK